MSRLILPAHVATIGLSAALLFSIQPLVARLILPTFGGAPAVWNTAVVFFQALLLAGYAYAHLSARLLRPPAQIAVHGGLLVVAFLVLPREVHLTLSSELLGGMSPVVSVIALLTTLIGLPFLAIAATAPLLQHWFSRSASEHADDPYFMYAASNAGAIIALAAYPMIIEPTMSLSAQTLFWAWAFVVMGVSIVACGILAYRSRGAQVLPTPPGHVAPDEPSPADNVSSELTWGMRWRWIALSGVGSATLLGVTLHITTDIAAVPFMWVVPLAIFLMSFVLTFARRPLLPHSGMLTLQVWVYVLLAIYFTTTNSLLALGLHLLALFVTVMVCHGELARTRPRARHLTEFYLLISLGGVIGGILSSIVAPLVFDAVLEYPLSIVMACLIRPFALGENRALRANDLILPMGILAIIALPTAVPVLDPERLGAIGPLLFYGLIAIALYCFRPRPVRFALGVLVLMFSSLVVPDADAVLRRERSFFGVYKVDALNNGSVHVLRHGTTVHGAQPWRPVQFARYALTYYNVEGPMGQIFATMNASEGLREVAVVGLGVGTLACYRRPGQTFSFYEIDPLVVEIARDERLFRYLSLCHASGGVQVGDGRLLLAREPDKRFDLIILDAFSSDAIPLHLVTREAVAMYASKLALGGVLAFHISNKYVRLGPVLGAIAHGTKLSARIQTFKPAPDAEGRGALTSTWVILARTDADLGAFNNDPRWEELLAEPGAQAWSDDYANLFDSLIWRKILRMNL